MKQDKIILCCKITIAVSLLVSLAAMLLLICGCTTTTFERPDGMRFSRTRLLQTESLHDVIVTDPCGVSVSIGSQSGDVSANGVELVIRGVEVVR